MGYTSTASTYATTFQLEADKKLCEEELVANLKKGCHKTFTYLYNNYCQTLYGVILDFIEDRDLAKDVLQEVFVNIYKKINTYDEGKSRLFTWMITVTRNLCIDTLRSKSYRNFFDTDEINENTTPLAKIYIAQVDTIGIHKLLDKIKPTYKTLIELSYYKGYTNTEIAEMMQIPLSTVKTRIRTALIQLRQHVQAA